MRKRAYTIGFFLDTYIMRFSEWIAHDTHIYPVPIKTLRIKSKQGC